MTGMDAIVALRSSGSIPECVFVYLVERADHGCPVMSMTGNLTVHVHKGEKLTDLDFRPLVGLYVHVVDVVGNPARHRKLAALIAEANPRLLVMPVTKGDKTTVHRRHAGNPPTTESITL